MKKLILLILAMSLPLFAQTTTTYQVTGSSSGRMSYPFRIFNIALTNGASIPWLEYGNGISGAYSCGPNTTSQPTTLGFIFLSGTVANDGYVATTNDPNPCFNLTALIPGGVAFAGVTGSGIPFSGTFVFTSNTYRCGSGRTAGTCVAITEGTLTIQK
jgi:hypothetical protein